ncbi:MAG: ribosome-associated translation inhibitor RaiA [Rhizobiales bacterium]|nr:ribosome-associated translation inhibitor RaiA [Hyphomicrobiales bacterium]
MPLRISGKNLDIGEALRARVGERVSDALGKYFDGGYSGHLTIGKDGFGFRTECAIHLDSGVVLQAEAMAADAYASADQAATRIEKRLRRYKRRLKDHAGKARTDALSPDPAVEAASYVIAAPDHDESDDLASGFAPIIIAESTTTLRRLSVSEAVQDIDMTGAPVLVFRHAGHGRVNIVYRRADGHIGWIDPPAVGPGGDVGGG